MIGGLVMFSFLAELVWKGNRVQLYGASIMPNSLTNAAAYAVS
jgi:hypothetical protein